MTAMLALLGALSKLGDAAICTVASPSKCVGERTDAIGYQGRCPPQGGRCQRCLPFFIANHAEDGVTREGCACLCARAGYALAGVEK